MEQKFGIRILKMLFPEFSISPSGSYGNESIKSITPVKLDGLEPYSTHPAPYQIKRPFFSEKTVHFGHQAHFWTKFGSRPATEAPFKSGWS